MFICFVCYYIKSGDIDDEVDNNYLLKERKEGSWKESFLV